MSKKKQSQEELMQTHVLNLDEIREAEKKENYSKTKRYPIFFAIIGVFLVLGGIIYSTFDYFSLKKEKVKTTNVVEKNNLTCISNYDDHENNLKVYTKTQYNFKNQKLISSDSTTSISLLSGNDTSQLIALKDRYSSIYVDSLGVNYKVYMNDNILYFDSVINNYDDFDYKNYNSEINLLSHTSVFHGEENIEEVKSSEKELGSLCN